MEKVDVSGLSCPMPPGRKGYGSGAEEIGSGNQPSVQRNVSKLAVSGLSWK